MFPGRRCCTSDAIGGQLLDRALRAVAAVTPSPAILTGKVRPRPPAPIEHVEVLIAGTPAWLPLPEWRAVERARAQAEALAKTPKAKRRRRV